MGAEESLRLALVGIISITNFLRQSSLLDNKTKESLDAAHSTLVQANIQLEESIKAKNAQFRESESQQGN